MTSKALFEDTRLRPLFWRHDYYTQKALSTCVQAIATEWCSSRHAETAHVFDFGAGSAPYRELFNKGGVKYSAGDLSGENNADILFQQGQEIHELQRNSQDLVLSFQVLEHVWDIDWYLSECLRMLKDDGSLILSTHGTWLYHPHPTDFRRWTRDGLVNELQARGFEITHISALVGPLAWTTQFRSIAYYHLFQKAGAIGRAIYSMLSMVMTLRMMVEDWVTPSEITASNAAIYVIQAKKSAASPR